MIDTLFYIIANAILITKMEYSDYMYKHHKKMIKKLFGIDLT